MSTELLETHLKSLVDLKKEEALLCKDVDAKIAIAMAELATLKELRQSTASPLAKKIADTEAEIKTIAITTIAPLKVHTFKCPFGTVALRSGYDHVTYEAKNLDKICEVNESVKSFIYPFRTSTPVAPTVTIKLKLNPEEQDKK